MKLIISTIVGFVVLFLLGWLFYGTLFMAYFEEGYKHIARAPESMRFWAIIVANLIQAFLLSYIYSKYFRTGSPIADGFKCGLTLGLYATLPMVFYMYASLQIPNWQVVVVDGLIIGVMTIITAIVIALVYGKEKQPAQQPATSA